MRRHKVRNPVACSPLLRKGGAHVQSKSGQRQRDKSKVKQEINEWKNSKEFRLFKQEIKEKGNQGVTLFLWTMITLVWF